MRLSDLAPPHLQTHSMLMEELEKVLSCESSCAVIDGDPRKSHSGKWMNCVLLQTWCIIYII